MENIKKYSFKIETVKILKDENSPYTLIEFEFLASNLKIAENYRKSLIEHYNNNKPYVPNWPYEQTELVEIDF